jgi:hypothetical protein
VIVDTKKSLQSSTPQIDNHGTALPSTPYELLMRQSRKLGSLAARTVGHTKVFLKKDITELRPVRPESILFGRKSDPSLNGVSVKEVDDTRAAVSKSHEILAGARTIPLPINLFPDSIIVDRTKVTITRRTFFWTSQVITTRIEDILAVTSNFGPIFGSLVISTRVMNSTDHYEVNYFWRKDAEYIKQIIQGYVIAQHNSIQTKHMDRGELVDTLLELGRDSSI